MRSKEKLPMKRRTATPAGIALVMVAASLTALMGFAALGIDLAFLMEAQGELSSAADATALASASGLSVSVDESAKKAEATSRGIRYAGLNKVLGEAVSLNPDEPFEFGRWDGSTFTSPPPNEKPTNAVRVSLELTGIQLFFAPVVRPGLGRVAASATAALVGSRDIVLTLDRSGSMNDDSEAIAPGTQPEQPLTDTKEAAKAFVDLLDPGGEGRKGDQVGLVSYSSATSSATSSSPAASLDAELTDDFAGVKTAIAGLSADGCTNIAAALCVARREATSSNANPGAVPVIVLLSDGKANQCANLSSCAHISCSGSSAEGDAKA